MENKKTPLSWEGVEKFLSEKTESGNLLALIETNKIFEQVLEKLKFPGKNINQKIEGLKFVVSDFNGLKIARKNYQKLISDPNFSIAPEEIEKIMTYYYKTIEEIIAWQERKPNFITMLKIRLAAYATNPRQFAKKIAVYAVIFFFIIFLLDSTKIGRGLVSLLVKISHFIFSWVLFLLLLIIGIIIIIVGAVLYSDSRKKEKINKIS